LDDNDYDSCNNNNRVEDSLFRSESGRNEIDVIIVRGTTDKIVSGVTMVMAKPWLDHYNPHAKAQREKKTHGLYKNASQL